MKKQVFVFATLLISGTVAMAQETPAIPKFEVGLNYSFERVNPGAGFSSYNANGGYGDVAYNFNRNFAMVADLGANYVGTTHGVALNNTAFEYLFGPRFNVRRGRFNPYVQALFGGQRFSDGFNPAATGDPRLNTSQNNFTAAIGGGLNITVSNHVAVRPFQVDYFMTQISPSNTSYVQNNLRYSAGVVFRLGSK